MCGLAATLSKEIDLHSVLKKMSHRGTRPHRLARTDSGSIGHVRLPIVGLGREHDQPTQRGQYFFAFVGQILDFREKNPEAECDLEDVIEAWMNTPGKGGGLEDRDGFWHVAVLDDYTGELHAYCDYLAQKPLYYRVDARTVASEIDPLVEIQETAWDQIYLSSVAKWGYCPEQWRTPYAQINKLMPGHMVTFDDRGRMKLRLVDPIRPVALTPVEIKEEIEAAVKRRVLSSDVPVAALVSGGIDSAIAYTLGRRHRDITAFHVENGEAFEASAVVGDAPAYLLDYKSVSVEKGLTYMQEPIDLGSLLPQVALSDAVGRANHTLSDPFRVCLSGDGADELFGGYGRSMRYDSQATDVWHELVCWHLPRLDRVMMRNTIELRSPFLARRVVSGAVCLPWSYRRDKQILRDLFRDDLPAGVADRPKKALRTKDVEDDREKRSLELIRLLKEKYSD
jgi:asparagine synthase (glutamine-hydrolysing)